MRKMKIEQLIVKNDAQSVRPQSNQNSSTKIRQQKAASDQNAEHARKYLEKRAKKKTK